MKKVTEKKSIATQQKDHTQPHIEFERVRTLCADRDINKNAIVPPSKTVDRWEVRGLSGYVVGREAWRQTGAGFAEMSATQFQQRLDQAAEANRSALASQGVHLAEAFSLVESTDAQLQTALAAATTANTLLRLHRRLGHGRSPGLRERACAVGQK